MKTIYVLYSRRKATSEAPPSDWQAECAYEDKWQAYDAMAEREESDPSNSYVVDGLVLYEVTK